MIPDLRNKDPERKGIDRTNVVISDIVDALISASGHLERFEQTAQSRLGGVANSHGFDEIIRRCELMKRRINDLRRELNRGKLDEDLPS